MTSCDIKRHIVSQPLVISIVYHIFVGLMVVIIICYFTLFQGKELTLPNVMEVLTDVAPKYESLGVSLGINYSIIASIRSDYGPNIGSILQHIIEYWLNSDMNSDMNSSWDKLTAALELCGCGALANHIRGDEQRIIIGEHRHKEVNSGVSGPRRLREGILTSKYYFL